MKKVILFIFVIFLGIAFICIDVYAYGIIVSPVLQYKFVNHDEVQLRWNNVEDADKYYIYSYDFDKMIYNMVGEVKTTQCRITKLEPTTKYRYAVAAVKIVGEEEIQSEVKSTEFTTPDEWYYFFDTSEKNLGLFRYVDGIPVYNDDFIFRQHYDGSGKEHFVFPDEFENSLRNMSESEEEIDLYDLKFSYNIVQYDGYVYFAVKYCVHMEDYEYLICRIKNDGSDFFVESDYNWLSYPYSIYPEAYGYANSYFFRIANCEEIVYSNYGYYENYTFEDALNEYRYLKEDGEEKLYLDMLINRLESTVTVFPDNKKIIKKKWYNFSNIISDNKYIYFVGTPMVNVYELFGENNRDAVLYRVNADGTDVKEVGKIGFTSNSNYNQINLLAVDNSIVYYVVKTLVPRQDRASFYQIDSFYKYDLNNANGIAEKMCTYNINAASNEYYKYKYDNGYIYFKSLVYDYSNPKNVMSFDVYCRVDCKNGKITKRYTPFEWYY